MNTIIQAHNSKMARLANVSQARRSQELDFFTEASYKYHQFMNSPSADNPYKNISLEEKVTKFFIEEAQRPDGIIAKQTKLNINIKNLSQLEIKLDKKAISDYFEKLEKILELGGALQVAIDDIVPERLPEFIADYSNSNINGTTEEVKDRNMFMVAGWANLFDYYSDVEAIKDFYFKDDIIVFSQKLLFKISGKTFQKYLHKKQYVMDDFLNGENIVFNQDGEAYYEIYAEVDSVQLENDDILNLYFTTVPSAMDLGSTFENAGITRNATIQPQYFLGGSFLNPENVDNPQADTAIKIPMYSVKDNKIRRYYVKPINTEAINMTPAYNNEVVAHIAGLFTVAGGDLSLLSGYSNKRLGLDLPLGIGEMVTPELAELYDGLSPEGKAGFVGNRYAFNKTGFNDRFISILDAQKAYMMSVILQRNLDVKLPQSNMPGQPSIVKQVLEDQTAQGRDLIKALNDNDMPVPEFYKKMLGIEEWQPGMFVYLQKLPEESKEIPETKTPEIEEIIEIYS